MQSLLSNYGKIEDLPHIHPAYRIWSRSSSREPWVEHPVLAVTVDMWRPALVGSALIPTARKIFMKIQSPFGKGDVELRPSGTGSLRADADGTLRFTLLPKTTSTIQWKRDPGLCLHLSVRPPGLRRVPKQLGRRLIHFGAGIHRVQGDELRLESGQTLHLDEGAYLQARVVCEGVRNVVIRGLGTIDLLANCPADPPSESARKEQAISIRSSRNVQVEGITVRNPSHYGISLGQSKGIRISHVAIFTHCRWGDGIDSMACSDVRAEHCFVRTSDDCIAVYADRGPFKGSVTGHCYRDCTLWADVAHPVMIGCHGKQKPPGRVIEDLRFERLVILRHCEASPMYQGCLALNPGDQNTIRDCLFSDIRIEDPDAPRLLDVRVLFNPAYNPMPGKAIHDIIFRRISYRGNPKIPSVVEGYDRHRRVWGIQIDKLSVNGRQQKSLPSLRTNPWAEPPSFG